MQRRPEARVLMLRGCAAVLSLALAINLVAARYGPPQLPDITDGIYYARIAQALAAGAGFVLDPGYWPHVPTAQYMPGWPFIVALPLKLTGGDARSVLRYTGAVLSSVNAVLLFLLGWHLFRRPREASAAAILYAA